MRTAVFPLKLILLQRGWLKDSVPTKLKRCRDKEKQGLHESKVSKDKAKTRKNEAHTRLWWGKGGNLMYYLYQCSSSECYSLVKSSGTQVWRKMDDMVLRMNAAWLKVLLVGNRLIRAKAIAMKNCWRRGMRLQVASWSYGQMQVATIGVEDDDYESFLRWYSGWLRKEPWHPICVVITRNDSYDNDEFLRAQRFLP